MQLAVLLSLAAFVGKSHGLPPGDVYLVDIKSGPQGEYKIGATVGTPAQNFILLLDTTTRNIVVQNKQSSSWSSGHIHQKYDAGKSSTSKKVSNVAYSDSGSARGYWYRDVLNIKGIRLDQGFLNADEISVPQTSTYDGVFGLGRKDPSKNLADNDVPSVYSMWEKRLLREPKFSIYLPPNENDVDLGEIVFGGSNNGRMEDLASLKDLPVTGKDRFWEIQFNGFCVEGRLNINLDVGAILDISSHEIGLPPQIYDSFAKVFKAATGINDPYASVSCELMKTAPTLSLVLNRHKYEVPANRYIVKGPSGCLVGVKKTNYGKFEGKVVLGSPFLRTYYSTYDILYNRVSLAKAKV